MACSPDGGKRNPGLVPAARPPRIPRSLSSGRASRGPVGVMRATSAQPEPRETDPVDYITSRPLIHIQELTTKRDCSMYSPILADLRGRLRRRAAGGAGSGVLRRRLVTAQPREARDPARQALRPGCEELA